MMKEHRGYRVLLSYYTPDWFSCKRKKVFITPGSLAGSSYGFSRAAVIIRGAAGLDRSSGGRAVAVVIIRGAAVCGGFTGGPARAVIIIRRITNFGRSSGGRAVAVVIIRGVAVRGGFPVGTAAAVVIIRGVSGRPGTTRIRAVPVVIIGRFSGGIGRAAVGFVMIGNLSRADETRRQEQHCDQFFHVSSLLEINHSSVYLNIRFHFEKTNAVLKKQKNLSRSLANGDEIFDERIDGFTVLDRSQTALDMPITDFDSCGRFPTAISPPTVFPNRQATIRIKRVYFKVQP